MKQFFWVLMALGMTLPLSAQTDSMPAYAMVEHVYISVKPGAQAAFEKAVKAHNANHHKGAHGAQLWNISTGKGAGTYVWSMGPCTWTDLDSRPSDDAHDTDWANNVGQHVSNVHGVEYWRRSKSYSNQGENPPSGKLMIWLLDIDRDSWYRFDAFMEKVNVIHKKMDETISVWYNRLPENNGRDVAIVWPFEKFADLDVDDWNMSEEFDKEHGDGAWDDAIKEWRAFVKGQKRQIWTRVE